MNKTKLKEMLRSTILPPGLVRAREQMAFNRLGRKPPELMWKLCQCCREPRAEARGVKIGSRLFVFGGYQSIDHVLSLVDVFDLDRRRWIDRMPMPPEIPQTHAGICCGEERFIYSLAGQLGPHCRPAVGDCFVLDTETKSWDRLPPLPEPRYSPVATLQDGRLHAISGAQPDRWTPACDHWSIGVAGGKALERDWRKETRIPKGGPHRASARVAGNFYVFGGQEGDMKPVRNHSQYVCDSNTPLETLYGESFRWEAATSQWKSIRSMATARTHSETEVVIGDYAVLVGGNEARHRLSDLVQVYDARADRWRIAGRLPYFMKTLAAYHKGWLYLVMGQRSTSRTNLRPDVVLNTVWRAEFDPDASGT